MVTISSKTQEVCSLHTLILLAAIVPIVMTYTIFYFCIGWSIAPISIVSQLAQKMLKNQNGLSHCVSNDSH